MTVETLTQMTAERAVARHTASDVSVTAISTFISNPTLRSVIDELTRSIGNKPFLLEPETEKSVNFASMRKFSIHLHGFLCGLGVTKGDRVAFLLDNSAFTAELFLAIMYAGFVVVPFNLVAGRTVLGQTLVDSEAKVVFASPEHQETAEWLTTTMGHNAQIVVCDGDDSQFILDGTDERLAHPLPAIEPDDDALIAYTSGSTGQPKGSIFSHRNVIAGGCNTVAAHGLSAADCSLCVLPLYHMNAQVVTLMSTLLSGGTVVVPRQFNALSFWSQVVNYQCTWFALVPTIVTQLIEAARKDGVTPAGRRADLQHVRFARSSSAPLSVSAHEAFESLFDMPMIEAMGMTEAGGAIFSNPLPPATRKIGSPGIAYGFEVKVVDNDGNVLRTGETGEILLRGDSILKAYVGHETNGLQRGFLRTGDLGYVDEDGFVFIVGRKQDVINKGGEKIAPREIEEVLLKHPSILEAAVVSVQDPLWGQDAVAYVACKPGHTCTAAELFELCESKVGAVKSPGRFEFMAELPRGTAHKVNKKALTAMARDSQHSVVASSKIAARTAASKATESAVLEVMSNVLGTDGIQADDNFFDLGGYSLLALKLLTKLGAKFNCRIPVAVLFAGPTAASLAGYIEQSCTVAPVSLGMRANAKTVFRSLVPLTKNTAGKPLFIVAGGTGGDSEFLVYARMVRSMPQTISCFGLTARASVSGMEPHTSVEAMAADYIKEIRELQPKGPYDLIGECSGGVVAYEMARQLVKSGEKVGTLALLDSRPSNLAHEVAERFGWFLSTIKRVLGGKEHSDKQLAPPAIVARTLDDKRRDDCWVAYKKPLLRYRAKPYAGKVHLLLSEEYQALNTDNTWRGIKTGEFKIVKLKGDHHSYIRENAMFTASVLSSLLDEASG